jgi:uncharacterized protein (DUF1800 family)
VLGREFDPYQPQLSDGRRVLDLVAEHPATASYVCEKLCRRLVSDQPEPALVAAAAKAWSDHRRRPDQIARTVEAIVRSGHFRRSAGMKMKRPLELYASFARATGIDVVPTMGLVGALDGSGHRLFGWGPPTGHPDEADYWVNSWMIRGRWSLLLGLANDAWKAGHPAAAITVAEQDTAESAARAAHRALLGREAEDRFVAAVVGGLGLKPGLPISKRKDALPLARRMLAYSAMTHAFQMR